MPNNWISTKSKMPEYEREVLFIAVNHLAVEQVMVGRYIQSRDEWIAHGSFYSETYLVDCDIIAWHEIPKKYKGE